MGHEHALRGKIGCLLDAVIGSLVDPVLGLPHADQSAADAAHLVLCSSSILHLFEEKGTKDISSQTRSVAIQIGEDKRKK